MKDIRKFVSQIIPDRFAMENRQTRTASKGRIPKKKSAIRDALALADIQFQKLAFDPGIRQIHRIQKVLDDFDGQQSESRTDACYDLAHDIFETLLNNLNAAMTILESIQKEEQGRPARENESGRFEKKFEIIRKIQDARNAIAELEKQRDAPDGNAEARKFEERFKLLKKIQETKADITSLGKEKRWIENKGELASPAELARKLDITADIVKLRASLSHVEENIASLDAKIKSRDLRHKLEILNQIQAIKDSVRAFENEIAAIHGESLSETKESLGFREIRENAIKDASEVIEKNDKLLALAIARRNGLMNSSRDEMLLLPDEKQTAFKIGPNLSALIEKLRQVGCPDGRKLIFDLCECFALFKEILAKRINPEIGAFDRYFLLGRELFDNILSEFRKIFVFLKAVGADREQELADQLNLLNLKENKSTADYDEIFEITPGLRKIQKAWAKVSKKLVKVKSAIRMIQEETVKISLRDGYRTNSDLAQARFRKLALRKSEVRVNLDVSIRKFEETCAMNQRILDRFEQHSVQHQRHSGNYRPPEK